MQNKTAQAIQSDIDSIRARHEAEMNLNQYRRDRMVGWSLIGLIVTVPAIAALIILL